MPHPARGYFSIDLSLSLGEAEALHAALASSRRLSPLARSIHKCLGLKLRALEWTQYDDTPANSQRLSRLLRRALRWSALLC